MKTQKQKTKSQQAKSASKKNNPQTGPAALTAAPAGEQEQAGKNQHTAASKKKNGGQTTISPPANVNTPAYSSPHILASGIDTLYLAVNLQWKSEFFFELLSACKLQASLQNEPQTLAFDQNDTGENLLFQVMAHGAKGYEWLIQNHSYTLKIGNWMEPKQRPNVMVEIRSETLWSHGPSESVNRIIEFLEQQDADIHEIKPSRVDLCVDMLFDEKLWTIDLIRYRATRANYASPHLFNDKLTGLSIGKGNIIARLYDKPMEIKQKKKKEWMYDVWGIKAVPEGKKIIRVEFQLRRQALNDLCLHHIYDFFNQAHNAWGYCSQKWLKFQDNPEKHHTQRHTFDWWQTVQNGFMGQQNPNPLIRQKAIEEDANKLGNQAIGLLSSMHALDKKCKSGTNRPVSIREILEPLVEQLDRKRNINHYNFNEEIQKKMARLSREKIKSQKAKSDRTEKGFPCMKPPPCNPAPEHEPTRQPRRRRLPIDTASDKTTCHRLAGLTSSNEAEND